MLWEDRDLNDALDELDDWGWTCLRDVDPSEKLPLRTAFRRLQRPLGWYVRTAYNAEARVFSVMRTIPTGADRHAVPYRNPPVVTDGVAVSNRCNAGVREILDIMSGSISRLGRLVATMAAPKTAYT